jgi:hypothetical protein
LTFAEMGKLWNSHSSLILIGIPFNGCLRVSKKTPLRSGPLDQSNISDQKKESNVPGMILEKSETTLQSDGHRSSSWNEVIMPLFIAIITP